MPTLTPAEFFRSKVTTPSSMTSADWERVQLETRERAFFMACVTRAEILDVFRQATAKVLTGEIGETDARRMIREGLARLGYFPRPGEEGTIKDLGTLRRQDVVIRTNIAMARNHAGYRKQWKARRAYPAKKMVRMQSRRVPRDWVVRWREAAAGLTDANVETMTALLDSPVWTRLSRFGAPYPPYDFNSGMGDIAVSLADAQAALGAEVVRAWLSGRPVPAAPSAPEADDPAAPAPAPEPGGTPTPAAPAPRPDAAPTPAVPASPDSTPAPPLEVPDADVPGAFPPVPTPTPTPTPKPGTAPAPGTHTPETAPGQPAAPDPAPPGPKPAPGTQAPETAPSVPAPVPAPAPAPAKPAAPAPAAPDKSPRPAPATPPEESPAPSDPLPASPSPATPRPAGLPLPAQPAPGLNATLEVTPEVHTPEGRKELEEALDGLAVWEGDKLVYTDPNGTKPYPADVIPGIISPPNHGDIPLRQRDALEAWAEGGAPALPKGSNLRAFFAALVWRILPMVEDAILTLTHWFGTAESRVEALAKLPQGGIWTPVTEFPFLAVAKSGAETPRPAAANAWPLTILITRYRTARDLTPAVQALAQNDAHGHHVLFPRGTSFRVESIAEDSGTITINLTEVIND